MNTVPHHASNDNIPLKRCPACPEGQEWHPATTEFFHRDKGSKDGLICWCKVCKSRKEKQYNQRPEVRNRRKVYREQHQERRSQIAKTRYESMKQQFIDASKTRYQVERERYRFQGIARRYGLTVEEWKTLFEQQDGKCALCRNDFDLSKSKFIQVDHCHTTGTIRGLLCLKCNVGLGAFGDNPDLLLRAVHYLEGSVL